MFKSVGKLFGMRRKAEQPKSRIDRRKTRVNMLDQLLDDSDEGSYHSTTSVSSESEYRESDDDGSYGSDSSYRPKRGSGREEEEEESGSGSSSSSEAGGKSAVSRGRRRKRAASAAALEDDSSESSDSDSDVGTEPRRKAQQKKRLKLPDSEDEALKEKKRESELKEAREAAAKRRERKNKLMELARRRKTVTPRRRRRTAGSEEEEEEEEVKEDKAEDKEKAVDSEDSSSEEDANPLMDSSEEEKQADSDSLKDFIVEEEEKKEGEEEEDVGEPKDKDFLSHLPRQFITGSQFTHFQVVVKALLINALDASFLESLYNGERTKRYAQEMKSSLHHFDERLVLPRLENLKQRSRWKDRYKERVECYPKVRITMVNTHTKGCEACELHRHGRFNVRLSGQLYHCNTLQEDQFMPDDSQSFFVGSVCASRTEVYHALKHFKYHLFERCRTALEAQKQGEEQKEEEEEDEPVKDTVNKVFTKLQEAGWINEQYDEFEEHLNAADFFQEEKLD
ncbi:coiled-coil domain-containing protein 82 [Colossoma macropomum]|uniref:coiled-coil domain-containing protein 82 n=1 Tax=Colossoma macropomum TaxID=42526 RepID=UPI00186417B4|nr:coiled-coil domain-containing protein 82 [Colossoma macropomum]